MDLSADCLHARLQLVAEQGWDGAAASELLSDLRRHVVRPVVRAHGLRGAVADQAEATGWAAAWEAIRRPTAVAAENPGGMVWSAVRRSIAAELRNAQRSGIPVADPHVVVGTDDPRSREGAVRGRSLQSPTFLVRQQNSPLGRLMDLLAGVGWSRPAVEEIITLLADDQSRAAWRRVADRANLPAWQVRRIAVLVRPRSAPPSLLELVARHGAAAVQHPAAHWAARSTRHAWQPGPEAALVQLDAALRDGPGTDHNAFARSTPGHPRFGWTVSESAQTMAGLP